MSRSVNVSVMSSRSHRHRVMPVVFIQPAMINIVTSLSTSSALSIFHLCFSIFNNAMKTHMLKFIELYKNVGFTNYWSAEKSGQPASQLGDNIFNNATNTHTHVKNH